MSLFTIANGLAEIKQLFQQFASIEPIDTSSLKVSQKVKVVKDQPNVLMSKSDILETYGQTKRELSAFLTSQNTKLLSVCGLDKNGVANIGQEYRESALSSALTLDNFDILAVFHNQYIVAFIIAQQGECNKHPTFWAVNLICGVLIRKIGHFLLNAMNFCAKRYAELNGLDNQKVILELASSYENTSGFLTYARSGFVKDMSLYYYDDNCIVTRNVRESTKSYTERVRDALRKRKCFCDDTLPMSFTLDNFSYDTIRSFMIGGAVSTQDMLRYDDYGLLQTITSSSVTGFNADQRNYVDTEIGKCTTLANKALEIERRKRKEFEEKANASVLQATQQEIEEKIRLTKQCLKSYEPIYMSIKTNTYQPSLKKDDIGDEKSSPLEELVSVKDSLDNKIKELDSQIKTQEQVLDKRQQQLYSARQNLSEQKQLRDELIQNANVLSEQIYTAENPRRSARNRKLYMT